MTLPSLSETFCRPSGEWSCEVCLVSNKATSTECVACTTPRLPTSGTNNAILIILILIFQLVCQASRSAVSAYSSSRDVLRYLYLWRRRWPTVTAISSMVLSRIGKVWWKIWSGDLDLWPVTLKYNRVLAVVAVHVYAKISWSFSLRVI